MVRGLLASLLLGAGSVSAQEVVGKRLFSDTLVISEPFVEDELSLPSFLHFQRPARGDEPRRLSTQIGAELKKRLTPDLELSLAGGLTHLDPDERPSMTGFDNLEVGLKYQFFRNEAREAVASLFLNWEVGGTGRKVTGAESFDTVGPALLFGKGFGDLPDAVSFLKPLAMTGALGARLPTRVSTPNLLQWGFVVEYSLLYLQSFVREVGLPRPFNRMVPLVEMDFQTALDRGSAGKTTGTANPGAVWVGESLQIGVEAVLPINERTGQNVGVRAFVRISLDEIFGGRLGRPLFGGNR